MYVIFLRDILPLKINSLTYKSVDLPSRLKYCPKNICSVNINNLLILYV